MRGAQPQFEGNLQAARADDMPVPKEAVLDSPDGRITYVDYNRNEVRTDLTRRMGARPRMSFTIFDRDSPGIPTDKPKGTIELIYVGDEFSIGRIVKTFNPTVPFRRGDIVYSPAWSPNNPMRFALIGKMDVNRDGRDDRGDLRRMIEAAGGIVDYDLPSPEAGKESGNLTGRCAWYVFDTRMPLVLEFKTGGERTTKEQDAFLKKQSEAIKEARLLGVRPMPIERLWIYLGYDSNRRDQSKPAEEAHPGTPVESVPAPGAMPANP